MIAQSMKSNLVSERGLVSGSISNGLAAKKTGQTNSFQDVMGQNLKKSKQESNSVSNQAAVRKKDTMYDTLQRPKQVASEKTNETTQSSNMDSKDLSQTEDVKEVITEQVSKLVEKLEDVLGLSTEELVELMTQLGIGVADLCNQDNLMKLLLTASGSENPSDILTDETLAGKFTELLNAQKNMIGTLEENGVTEEDISQWQDQWMNPQAEQSQSKENPIETKNQDLLQLSEGTNLQEKEPVIEVVHKEQAVKNLNQTESENVLPEETTIEESQDVSNVQAEDAGAGEEDVLLEKQESIMNKADSNSEVKETASETPFESFMNQLTKSSTTVTETVQGQNGSVTTVREIVNQVVSKIRMVVQPDMSSMELQLHPENLGKVQLLVTSREGEMTAHFAVQNETAKAALESQIQLLRENLNNQGLKVEAIEVAVSDFSFSQSNGSGGASDTKQNGQKHSRRQINLEDLNELDYDLSEEEELAVKIMRQNGGNIDYTA